MADGVAFVTGGGRGIGANIARSLAADSSAVRSSVAMRRLKLFRTSGRFSVIRATPRSVSERMDREFIWKQMYEANLSIGPVIH